ncbi:hypothetical protein, partial [Paraburkholderia phenoliruptrix]
RPRPPLPHDRIPSLIRLQQSRASSFGVGQNPMNHSQELEPPQIRGGSGTSFRRRCRSLSFDVIQEACRDVSVEVGKRQAARRRRATPILLGDALEQQRDRIPAGANIRYAGATLPRQVLGEVTEHGRTRCATASDLSHAALAACPAMQAQVQR